MGWLCLLAVLGIAAPLALFEVWGIGHYKVGWGEPLPKNKAWAKQVVAKVPFSIVRFQLLTRYHFVTYLILVPTAVGILGTSSPLSANWHWFGWAMFVVAGTMGVMVLEDFLFFVLNTILEYPYPHAITRLFRGEATWHLQKKIGRITLPASYLWIPPAVAFLLWLGSRFGTS